MRQNTAGTCLAARMARICWVLPSHGPSSKVSETRFPPAGTEGPGIVDGVDRTTSPLNAPSTTRADPERPDVWTDLRALGRPGGGMVTDADLTGSMASGPPTTTSSAGWSIGVAGPTIRPSRRKVAG